MGRVVMTMIVALAATLGTAEGLTAQEAPRGWFWLGFSAAEPQGDLANYFDAGWGGHLGGALRASDGGHVRLRGDLGVLIYGNEDRNVCFPAPVGCRIGLELNTTNAIIHGTVGPEVVWPNGLVEPYAHAGVGFTYFATTSSLKGDNDADVFANTTNFSDGAFAWTAGGGFRVRLKGGPRPIHLDLGLERHQNGIMEFLTEGDIIDHPDGSITLLPHRSEADLLVFGLGVSFGFGGGDG